MTLRVAMITVLLAVAVYLSRNTAPVVTPTAPPWPPGLPEEAVALWRRALGITARNPAPAILVSRYQFERLRPLRSWQDMERLRDYVEWADRTESVGFSETGVDADVSAGDLVLLRRPRSSITTSAAAMRDPVGFTVLAAPRPGRQRIPVVKVVSQVPAPAIAYGLTTRLLPAIRGVVARSKTIVEIYGVGFSGSSIQVFSKDGEARVVYAGANQVNAVVAALDRVAVEVDGYRSDWHEVRP